MSGISQEEFQRMQTQLLDLRTANYTLMEESNRHRIESRNAVTRLEQAEKELSKVRGTLEKSRRARDVEQLFAENEALQHKLFSQEEEFRLQNRTLMDELGLLVATNEKLEATLRASVGERLEATVQCDLADEEQAAERRQLEDRIRSGSLAVETLEQQLAELRRSAAEEADQLRSQLARAQAEADLTPGLRREIDERRDGEAKLSAEVQKLGDELNAAKTRAADVIGQMSADHSQELEVLRLEWAGKEKEYEIQLELTAAQRAEFEVEAAQARQEARDALEDARIADRRIASVTHDLRRQLRAERRRADKLQERLRDLISTDSSSSAAAAAVGPPSAAAAADGDSCSVSSWSLMSGQNESVGAPATPDPQGGDESPDATDPLANGGAGHVDLGAENARLVARLAQTQQDKWRLEERVSHLEESNAAMADEMVRRGQLIQFYCMDQRPNVIRPENSSGSPHLTGSEKLSMRRMVSLIRQIGNDSGDSPTECGPDVQKRLQRMLEETLTKNMHLTEDLERLSQEVVRLSQLVGSAQINAC